MEGVTVHLAGAEGQCTSNIDDPEESIVHLDNQV